MTEVYSTQGKECLIISREQCTLTLHLVTVNILKYGKSIMYICPIQYLYY